MNRISGPDGLPHSCAEIVRPSGVFTLIGLCFGCSAMAGCAMATRNAATNIFIVTPPYLHARNDSRARLAALLESLLTPTRAAHDAAHGHRAHAGHRAARHGHGALSDKSAHRVDVRRPEGPSPRDNNGRVVRVVGIAVPVGIAGVVHR